jgi:hypothetical protein
MAEINQFELARRRAKQRSGAETQAQQGALKRRFATLGGLGSGASIKAEQQAAEQGAQRVQQATEGIDVAEAQDVARKEEIQEARKFQTSERLGQQEFAKGERLGGQSFAAEQAGIGREFQTSERIGGQKFANAQRLGSEMFAGAQSELQRDLAKDQFNKQMVFEKAKHKVAQSQFMEQMALALKQFGLDEKVTNANLKMQKNSKEGQFGVLRSEFGAFFDRGISGSGVSF